MYTQCVSHCYFLRKWRNDSSSGIASNFARSLVIAKWKPFRRFSGFSVTMPWASHKLRSGTTDSEMAAHWWRDTHSSRPSTSRNDELIDQVRTLVMQDHRVTIRELVEEVGISTRSVHSILTDDLAMRRVSAKFMLKLLTMEQNFLGQTQHSCGSTGSLLSRHGSLQFLAVPPPENAAERDSI